MSDEEKHGSRCKIDGCPTCKSESRTLEEALSEIHVLWIRSRSSGDLIAWWYHPNREALEEKRALLETEGFQVELHRFVRGA